MANLYAGGDRSVQSRIQALRLVPNKMDLRKRRENVAKDLNSTRKDKRSTILNTRRGIEETQNVAVKDHELIKAAKLKEWQEKKRRRYAEELTKRPAFNQFVKARHTGLSPYARKDQVIAITANKRKQIIKPNRTIFTLPEQMIRPFNFQMPGTKTATVSSSNSQVKRTCLQRSNQMTLRSKYGGAQVPKGSDPFTAPPSKQQSRPVNTRQINVRQKPPPPTATKTTAARGRPKPKLPLQSTNPVLKSSVAAVTRSISKTLGSSAAPTIKLPVKATTSRVMTTAVPRIILPEKATSSKVMTTAVPTVILPEKATTTLGVMATTSQLTTTTSQLMTTTSQLMTTTSQLTTTSSQEMTTTSQVGDCRVVSSPYVTVQRSHSARRSRSRISLKDSLHEELKELPNGATFQRRRMMKVKEQLLGLAEDWSTIRKETNLPVWAAEEIDATVGLTHLLTVGRSSKFTQFSNLVDNCEANTGSQVITFEDIDGFWEMMYLQVVNLEKKYNQLQQYKQNSWEQVKVEPKKTLKQNIKKVIRKSVQSKLKALIKARKNNLEEECKENKDKSGELKSENMSISDGEFQSSGKRLSLAARLNLSKAEKSRRSSFGALALKMSLAGKILSSPSLVVVQNFENAPSRGILRSPARHVLTDVKCSKLFLTPCRTPRNMVLQQEEMEGVNSSSKSVSFSLRRKLEVEEDEGLFWAVQNLFITEEVALPLSRSDVGTLETENEEENVALRRSTRQSRTPPRTPALNVIDIAEEVARTDKEEEVTTLRSSTRQSRAPPRTPALNILDIAEEVARTDKEEEVTTLSSSTRQSRAPPRTPALNVLDIAEEVARTDKEEEMTTLSSSTRQSRAPPRTPALNVLDIAEEVARTDKEEEVTTLSSSTRQSRAPPRTPALNVLDIAEEVTRTDKEEEMTTLRRSTRQSRAPPRTPALNILDIAEEVAGADKEEEMTTLRSSTRQSRAPPRTPALNILDIAEEVAGTDMEEEMTTLRSSTRQTRAPPRTPALNILDIAEEVAGTDKEEEMTTLRSSTRQTRAPRRTPALNVLDIAEEVAGTDMEEEMTILRRAPPCTPTFNPPLQTPRRSARLSSKKQPHYNL